MGGKGRIGQTLIVLCVAAVFSILMALSAVEAHAFTFPRITAETLKDLVDKGEQDVVIVDTQSKDEYRRTHIQGAINLPWSTDIGAPENLPYDKMLILYCNSPDEKESSDVARQIQSWDYVRIKILKGGLSGWKKLGYPVEKGLPGAPGAAKEKISRITVDELKKLMDQGADLVILDVQSKAAYTASHIKGAISFPWKAKISQSDAGRLPKNTLIVTYCDCGPGEADSDSVAQQLRALGYTKTMVLKDPSIRGWKTRSYPIE
jgi:rhodanese-related sulfurtransferase